VFFCWLVFVMFFFWPFFLFSLHLFCLGTDVSVFFSCFCLQLTKLVWFFFQIGGGGWGDWRSWAVFSLTGVSEGW